MTQWINNLAEIASDYDAIVFDQWGVLHDGSVPYPGAIAALEALRARGAVCAVLSNSGKRAGPNAARIAGMGFAQSGFTSVMTSGEALWQDIAAGRISARRFWPIERGAGDAAAWAEGLDIALTRSVAEAEAVLLMGLPDGATLADWEPALAEAHGLGLPVYCSNPDRKSPRAGGLVISPGALGFAYADMGGRVLFYGKPHRPIFDAVERTLGLEPPRILMVGDSLEHDIAGAAGAGWDSLFVAGGLYAQAFADADRDTTLAQLCADQGGITPTHAIGTLA